MESGEDFLYYFVVDGSKRYDFEQGENVRSIALGGDEDQTLIVNSVTIPRGIINLNLIQIGRTMRVGGGVVEESVSWSDSSSSSWSSNEVEMQFVNHPMPMSFKPKQIKPCLKLATTTTKTTTTENPYCGNNN